MTRRLYFLPDHGWAGGASHEPVRFDRNERIPAAGMAQMGRIATMASETTSASEWRRLLVDESAGGSQQSRTVTIAVYRLCCEYPVATGMGLEQKYPGTLIELDASPVESLWGILRVMAAREETLRALKTTGPNKARRARELGGDLLATRETALQLATRFPEGAQELYLQMADAIQALDDAAVLDVAPAVGALSDEMPAIGSLQLTAEQATACAEVLRKFRRMVNRCQAPEDDLPWDSKKLSDPEWARIDRQRVWPRCMVVAGAAGVGKSFTMLYLVLRLMQQDPSVVNVALTAYTHNAAKVLETYFDVLLERLNEEVPDLHVQTQIVQVEMAFVRKVFRAWRVTINGIPRYITRPRTLLSTYTTFGFQNEADFLHNLGRESGFDFGINDEASMVPRETLRALVANAGHPVLMVGDPAQLPPVGELQATDAPDMFNQLVAEGFAGRLGAFGNLMEATNLRTHGGRGGILKASHAIREHIKLPPDFKAKQPLRARDQALTKLEEFLMEAARDDEYTGITRSNERAAIHEYAGTYWDPEVEGRPARTSLIVSGTHQTRSRVNNEVRRLLGFEGTRLMAGETLIVESAQRVATGGDVSLANNEFVWVTEVISPIEKRPVFLHDGTDNPGNSRKEDERLLHLMNGEDDAEARPKKGEIRFDVPIDHIDCAHCVVCTATGAEAEVHIPHSTLLASPKIRKRWQDKYMTVYGKLKRNAEKIMRQVWGKPWRPGTFAAIALWSRDRTLQIPDARGGKRIVRPFREMGIPDSFRFNADLRAHYVFGQHRPFIPDDVLKSMNSKFEDRERRIVMEMLGFQRSSLLFAHAGYCITGHASQGSQFDTVYVTLEPPSIYRYRSESDKVAERSLQECLRWLYVAMTRAENNLVIIGSQLASFDRKPGGRKRREPDDPNRDGSAGGVGDGGFLLPARKVSQEEDLF